MRALRRQVLDVQPVAHRVEVETAIAIARRGERVPIEQFNALTKPERGRVDMHRPDFNARIKEQAESRMKHLDSLPHDFRVLANELGLTVVEAFYRAGIKKVGAARHLICLARGEQIDGRPAAFGNRRLGK